MKFHSRTNHLIIAIVFWGFTNLQAQDCGKAITLISRLQEEHLEPRILDDSLSKHIFTEVFFQFDPSKIFFHQEDISRFEKFRFTLDNEFLDKNCSFQSEFRAFYLKKIEQTKIRIDSLLRRGLSFNEKQAWPFVRLESERFALNEKGLKEKITRDLKHDILRHAYQKHRLNDTSHFTLKSLNNLLPTVVELDRQQLAETFAELIKQMASSELFEAIYLKAIAKVYDPHSDYFTQTKKVEFDEQLSDERLSFGIDLSEDAFGRVEVQHIVPGGPAWKSGLVHKGDVPLKITWDDLPAVDLTEKDLAEINKIFHGATGKQARLVVRKPSGESVSVDLEKEKIENTENSILGFILSGKQKVGYIHLPGFFSGEQENKASGCANEVAKEILKLSKQKIEGLILDLRDNGGGSLQEAVDLAGIFIDGGPMTIFAEKGQQPISVKDANRGMSFSGPMIVLVNGHSASASELVAAALQDYNRAVIVGAQTFGKATGQVVMPLEKESQTDFFKVTKSKLYRLNQKSLQQIGVVPDIMLPEIGAPVRQSERSYRHALVSKSTEKKTYYNVMPLFFLEPLRAQSKARIENKENFKAINLINQMIVTAVPLKADDYIAYVNALDAEIKKINTLHDSIPYTVKPSESFLTVLDDYRKPSENLLKEISNSPYIQEAYHIMCDMIASKK